MRRSARPRPKNPTTRTNSASGVVTSPAICGLSAPVLAVMQDLSIDVAALLRTDEPLWTEENLRVFLGLKSRRGVQAWRRAGFGPPYVRVSGSVARYFPALARAWALSRLRASTSDPDPDPEDRR